MTGAFGTPTVSIAIPTYGREAVLVETIDALLSCRPSASEILIIDQTVTHERDTEVALAGWAEAKRIDWIRLPLPSITNAMNTGLLRAKSEIVLFVDDDILPSTELVGAHALAYDDPLIAGVVGQVLQPEENVCEEVCNDRRDGLMADLDFRFNSRNRSFVRNAMAGNLSVRREFALRVGGFDENFVGSAYRFETEFARRLWRAGGKILFEPGASLRHLRAERGGTRAKGTHMTSASPLHGVGDYYFALRQNISLSTVQYILRRPFREVRTRFHLSHPWWIPVKFIGELRAMTLALRLYRKGPNYIVRSVTDATAVSASHRMQGR